MNTNVMAPHLVESTPGNVVAWLGPRKQRGEWPVRLTQGLIRAATVAEVTELVERVFVRETPAESCLLFAADAASGRLEPVGAGRASLTDFDRDVADWVVSRRLPMRLDDASADDRFVAAAAGGRVFGSLISLPLMTGGSAVGAITLTSGYRGAFSDRDEQILRDAAPSVAAALDRARGFDALEREKNIVDARMAELEKLFTQSEKMSAVGRLLAGIVHELNNPLTTILGFSQLLARAGGEGQKDLERIVSESERCARIVRSVLRISRPGSAEREIVDLNSSIRETLELASHQMRLSKIGLGVSLAPTHPRIFANPCELTQVLLNLVTNAVQAIAGGRGEGAVDVSTSVANGRVSIRVRDNGPGIGPGQLPRIFEPFFTTKEDGTGLGLSLSRQLVEANDGTISVTSRPDEGTTFILEFPTASEAPIAGDDKNRRKVLVADDERHILDLVQALLPSSDYEVDCAQNGAEAMEKVESRQYDLLISDLRMPGIDGRELVEWVRSTDPSARVLFLTGDVAGREVRDFIARSGAACLVKPFRIGDLIRAVEDAFAAECAQ